MATVSTSHEQRILEVARDLFTRRGFANVAMRDICRAANVTPPTVYYYFKSKEALFEAVVRETVTMSEFIGHLTEETGKAKSAEGKVQAFTRTYLSIFPKDLLNTGLYLRRSTELDPLGKKTLVIELGRIQSLLTDIIKRGVEGGEFRRTDPRMAAECLLGMMNRFVFQRIHFQRNYNLTETTDYMVEFFLRAMKPG